MNGAEPHLFVIVGATGDLTRRKLLPALYKVITESGIAGDVALLGVSRTEIDDATFRGWAVEALREAGVDDPALEEWCASRLFYEPTPDGTETLETVAARVDEIEGRLGLPGNRVLYLALPPVAFPSVITQLGEAGLNHSAGWTRLVIEKPFGRDLESARRLNEIVHAHFDESQVYRIDHYLGKETVQNLLAFRFANLLFESSWNRDRVASVEITVAESLGIEGRAEYYDATGVLRDMVQNHLTQLLSLIAMEAPNSFAADDIRSEKVQLLGAVSHPIEPSRVVYGQYTAGIVEGAPVPGYLEADGVAPGSSTPTFMAARLAVNNWRWEGVPFFLRTGKRLPRKTTEIAVKFKAPPVCLFHGTADSCEAHQNVLVFILQPNEGFELHFDVKAPGEPLRLVSERLRFAYDEVFDVLPDAYQTLILDIMQGDQTLFVRADEVEASWELWSPLLDADIPVHPYPAGSWGPEAVNGVLGKPDDWFVSKE